jgi:hypothetical protein
MQVTEGGCQFIFSNHERLSMCVVWKPGFSGRGIRIVSRLPSQSLQAADGSLRGMELMASSLRLDLEVEIGGLGQRR